MVRIDDMTWWIIRWSKHILVGVYYRPPKDSRAIGPYWSYEEAERMIKKWS